MNLFKRTSEPRRSNFRPAIHRRDKKRHQSVHEPKTSVDLTSLTVTELKEFLTAHSVDFTGVTVKADLLALAKAV